MKVWRDAEVLAAVRRQDGAAEPDERSWSTGAPSASAAIWGMTVFDALPRRPPRPDAGPRVPSGLRPKRTVEGFGNEVLPQP